MIIIKRRCKPTIFVHVWVHVASVKLEEIHVPVCKRLSIQLQEVQTPRESRTGLCTDVLVNAELQTLPVNL